jgi:uncharacterized phage infection (PIP) family protein YhgE
MPILEKTMRRAAIAFAVLFISLSFVGIWGAWFVDRWATDVALKAFGLIETGVGVVDAGVGRVEDLLVTSRTEVRQASETITAVGVQAQANSPALNALNERLETSLAPGIAQMKQDLVPVRDAVVTIGNVVSLMNSLPMIADRAPGLEALDETFNRLEELSSDTSQLRGTLRTLAGAQTSDVIAETVTTLNGLTRRIDTRLGEVQANVQGVQADIAALQVRLEKRKSQLLFLFNGLALLSTLILAWILYTQIVVIQHHRARIHRRAAIPESDVGPKDQTGL